MTAATSFETHEPVDLYVEIGKGSVEVTATDTTEPPPSRSTGRDAERGRASSRTATRSA